MRDSAGRSSPPRAFATPAKRRVRRAAAGLTCLVAFCAAGLVATGGTDALALVPRSQRPVVRLSASGIVTPDEAVGLLAPEAIAIDHRGRFLVVDTGNHRILILSREGSLIDEFGGYGWERGRLDTPSDLSVYPGFYTYVLDRGNRRVVRYDDRGDFLDVVVPEDQAGSPVSIAVGPAGGLFLVDSDSQSVLSYSQFDERLEPVGSFGTGRGGLVDPAAVFIGPGREIAVADPGSGSVEVFDEFGGYLFAVTAPDSMYPLDVVVDAHGNILVADGLGRRVLAFPPHGGAPTASYDGGGEAFEPYGLALGRPGEVLALERSTGRIHQIEILYGGEPPTEQ